MKKVEMREIEVFVGMNEGLKWVLSGEYGPPIKLKNDADEEDHQFLEV